MTAGTQSRKPLGGSHRKLGPLILGAILLVAFALRLYGLNAGLWYDEILTSINYARMSFFQIITTYDSQNQHFLFSLLARASILIFGESAWALRLPAVIFGVASIWALYLLGREIGSETEALLSAALLTFSYHHIWFSQNARGYTGLLFWTILSSWLLLRALREGRPRLWLLYAAAAALGMYTHLTMIFVIIGGHFAVYLAAFLFRRRESWPSRWSGMFLGFGLSGFFTLLLYAPALPQFAGGFFGEEGNVITWKNPLWTLLEVARGMQLGFAGAVAALVALLVFGAGLFIVLRTNPALIQLLIIPAVLGAGVTLATGHYVWPRFFFFAI
ncbi:MAG: glycosyltransferase family 39 protein, partial [Anaerolineae bacterium]|nr:glycosyltransferase family 39 protein [Anaerolineae bacterium]